MHGGDTGPYDPDYTGPYKSAEIVIPGKAETEIPRDVTILPQARVGRTHRESVVEHLNQMMAEEYITPEEHQARVRHAEAAPTHDHLNMLTSDLPPKPLSRWNGVMGVGPARKNKAEAARARYLRRVALSWVLNLTVALAGELAPPAMTTSLAGRIAPMLIFGIVSVLWGIFNVLALLDTPEAGEKK